MRKFCLFVMLVLLACVLRAVPARPQWFVANQADGSRISLRLCGDENQHYFLTQDGLPVMCGTDGSYYHVALNAFGQLTPSSVLAHETSDRDLLEQSFLEKRGGLDKTTAPVRRKSASRKSASIVTSFGERSNYVGTKRGLVILAQFPDCKFSIPNVMEYYQEVLNGSGAPQYNIPASVNQYFLDQSNGVFNLQFDVVGPVTVSNKMSYYGSNDSWGNDNNAEKMVEEAVRLSAPNVNYSDYDWDKDGFVDQVFVLYAGYSEAQNAPSYTIWPHAFSLSSAGITCPLFNGVKIDAYACCSELYGKKDVIPDGIGTFCHEFSHCMGLPDLYDIDYSGGYGMYIWSLMDAGCYCGPDLKGEVPCNYTGYERWLCGWAEVTELQQGCIIDGMTSITENGPTYMIKNKAHADEFYLLENRQQKGWDKYLPAHGLLVMHVDYDENAWFNNTVNDVASHQRFAAVPADNQTIQSIANSMGDLFPGSSLKTSLTDNTLPATKLFHVNSDGRKFLGRPIEQIEESSEGKISFVFDGGKGNSIANVGDSVESSSAIYTLQGVRVFKVFAPGVYVVNGRKVYLE